ncbi:MAG: DMT family transporter [Acidimicrobiia bacterium]|nr:DMT family transporter [Acidimicrobiia bacterium]
MPVLLGLLAALSWGTGDFSGGMATRRAPESAVVLGTESIGLVLLLGVALFAGGSPTGRDLGFGSLAGILGVAGLMLLYRGLARGRASVVAPLSAVGAAVLQVTWGLAGGERPGATALIGIALAFVAIGVVAGSAEESTDQSQMSRIREIQCGLGAAVGFGFYLILISETTDTAGLWTVVAARVAPVVVLLIGLGILRRPMAVPRAAFPMVTLSGVTDAGANALLLVAVRQGLLSVVAPVANLFPVVTVILARAFGHEKIGRARMAGLVLAVASLVLIST